jgi:hypothetical protein
VWLDPGITPCVKTLRDIFARKAPKLASSEALCRARAAEKLQHRRKTRIAEHLKLVLNVIDRQER